MEKNVFLIILLVLLSVALTCVILAGALYSTQWGFFVLFPYSVIPIVGVLCSAAAGDSDSSNTWNQFGYFMESFMWVSAFGIPSVCFHVDAINASQFAFLLAATAIVMVAYLAYAKFSASEY